MKATFWDKRSEKYDDHITKHDSIYVKTIERTKSLLNDSDVVLDFACASGEMCHDIAPLVQRVHGIDLSEKMIELANQKVRERQVENINFDQVDAFDQRLEGNSFSAIIAFSILHLLEDAPKVLDQLNDLLQSGGLLISQTPCLGERSWIFKFLISLAQKVGIAPLILSLTITELESLVSSSNFEIFETKIWDEKNAVQWIVARKYRICQTAQPSLPRPAAADEPWAVDRSTRYIARTREIVERTFCFAVDINCLWLSGGLRSRQIFLQPGGPHGRHDHQS